VKYLIDTNVISEIRKGARCNANVARWWANVHDHELYLSVLVLGEIRKGIQLARRRSAERARTLELWLGDLCRAFDDRLLDVDRDIADEWGHMSGLRNVATIDGLLAATAKVRRMTLVTRNSSDVEGLGANVLNPFNAIR
jgi:predicted nucleic acid-binding protein